MIQPSVAHLVGTRCFSKASRRLGTVDRAVVTGAKSLVLIVIFDDGETHKGCATEFQAVKPKPLTLEDCQWLNKLGIEVWNPAEVLVP